MLSSLLKGNATGNGRTLSEARRFFGSLFGTFLFGSGCWLLYRHLVHGDEFSVTLTLGAFGVMGWGAMMLPTAILGRSDW